MKYLLPLVCGVVFARAASAQTCHDETRVLEEVRTAIAVYADVAIAEQDGYRRIGQDFPAMGEHWVSSKILSANTFDLDHPNILLYARKGDRRELVGAAFTVLMDPGDTVPGPRSLRDRWHEHAGTLEEELFAVEHKAHSGGNRFKVLVLHVWTALPHQSDAFAVENWRLPWFREGVEKHVSSVNAARMVSLISGSDYWAVALTRVGVPAEDMSQLEALLDDFRTQARAALDNEKKLAGLWNELMSEIAERWPATRLPLHRLRDEVQETPRCPAS